MASYDAIVSRVGPHPPRRLVATTKSVQAPASIPPTIVYSVTTAEPTIAPIVTDVPKIRLMITPIAVTCAVM